ncbi:hypothetical protein ACFFJ4_22920, partial [Xanthomonas dyei]
SASSPSNQHALDGHAQVQAASAAQARQEQQQQDRQAQDQQLAQARDHALQEQVSHEDRTQATQALQAHAVLELRQQESQQLEQQERQVQDAQQREQVQQQAQETQQRQQETRQAQESQQERLQAQTVQHAEQQPLHAQAAPQREQEPENEAVSREPSSLHAQDTSARQPEQRSTPDDVVQRPQERLAEPAQTHAFDVAQQQRESQRAQEERPQEVQQQTAHSAASAQTAPADQQQVADLHNGQRSITAQASEAQQDAPAQQHEQLAGARLAQAANAPSLATPIAAEQRDDQQARTPHAQAPEAPDTPAALPLSAHLAQATGAALEVPTAGRSADAPEGAADAREPLSASLADDRPAAVPADPDSWEEIERSMRELRIQLEQELETENRVAEARQARVDRGERPFTELELRDGYDPDGPSGLRPPRAPPADIALQPLAAGEQEDRPQPQRKNITGDPDVDELLYAIDCKDELAIEQALKRVANSPYSQALAKQGHEFLDAQAMQEAQEQASTRQALNMDVSTEVQTSRGPVMVMTLPQFANGPAMQGPQGDGGGGG